MRYRRDQTPGASYFFTVVTRGRHPVFCADPQVNILREVFREVRSERPFSIDAIVVLPEHIHALWKLPEGDTDYSTRWQMIKARFSRRDGGTAWQKRFWEHRIRDDEDHARHIDYIHWNPVRHGLVTAPGEWPWSSFRKYQQRGYYGHDWRPKVEPVLPFGAGQSDI
ncbi:transposase [Skermanella mucosa]|uniref:REP-associated tyrosine transposase n=1 Tax=Skermanella mucosa TaxID=1789672 RepID=UPI00192B2F36|nr:transposase [Skermanella mucosa]UEM22010.1 transposase [Skermanella mucosa]